MPLQSERDSLGHFLAWKSMAAGGVAALRLRHRVVLQTQIGADHRRLDRLSPRLCLGPSGPRRGVDLRCLTDPDAPIDTNHLERGLRPIPIGRKNWLYTHDCPILETGDGSCRFKRTRVESTKEKKTRKQPCS